MSPEEQFVRAFVRKDRRRRYLALVSTVKGREKFREALAHRLEVELENVQPIPPRMQSPAAIAETLRGLGAPKLCYIISESRDLDGKTIALDRALEMVVGRQMGTVIICSPNLAFFEAEGPKIRFILRR
jgi:DNA-binding MarR family transcriptional regulator